jgi:hypothetical protein
MSDQESFDSFEKVTAKLREHDGKLSSQYAATDDLIKRVCKLERQLADMQRPRKTA